MNVEKIVNRYVRKKKRYDEITKQYQEYKQEFEEAMTQHFDSLGRSRKNVEIKEGDETIRVTKVEPTTIEWDKEKLRRKVPIKFHKQIFKKRYEITDYAGLVQYLKKVGANPAIFKQYVTAEESVDIDAIDHLGEIGAIGVNEIKGCYNVKVRKPSFRIHIKKTKK